MSVWRKSVTRWNLDGQSVPSKTPGAKKRVGKSRRFYGNLRLASGQRKQLPLTELRDTSQKLLRRLQSDEDRARALGFNHSAQTKRQPLDELIGEYEQELQSRENTPFHIGRTIDCIDALISATKAKLPPDLDPARISSVLKAWRDSGRPTKRKGRKRSSMSVSRSNVYTRAIKGFSRWLWMTQKTPHDLLVSLQVLNAKTDRRHVRKALTTEELRRLIAATAESGVTVRSGEAQLTPQDRAMLYTIAAYTGLRASELASLTVQSFNLETMTVTVQAAYSKRRRDDVLPLHQSMRSQLHDWLTGKRGKVWPGVWAKDRRGAAILRADLKRAAIPERDEQGRVVDFHALRHTFIANLARNGVHPGEAKSLARHSTITLTMDVYGHVEPESLRRSLNALPSIG